MLLGTSAIDITPRIGVELAGFGPYRHRYSIGVRAPLMAKAFAFESNGKKAIIINCELCGLDDKIIADAENMMSGKIATLSRNDILICCTHTHSGPAASNLSGWGEIDLVYVARLADKIAEAGIKAFENMEEVNLSYGEAPCEHIALNRERDVDGPAMEEVLKKDWRPAKPEFTDTVVKVLKFTRKNGELVAFATYFGCHPVVCCAAVRHISGDFPAIAMRFLEEEFPSARGVFWQGAQGDVNSCVVYKGEEESLNALDIIATRFAISVRAALANAVPIKSDKLVTAKRLVTLTPRSDFNPAMLDDLAATQLELVRNAPTEAEACRPMVLYTAAKNIKAKFIAEPNYKTKAFFSGIRIGDLTILGAPFEIMQKIKNEVVENAVSEKILVLGLSNGAKGYAPDNDIAEQKKGSYTTDFVPMFSGEPPFEDIHGELCAGLLAIDHELNNEGH